MTGLKMIGIGRALPSRCVTNDDLSKIVDTNDAWISERTGIRRRYITAPTGRAPTRSSPPRPVRRWNVPVFSPSRLTA